MVRQPNYQFILHLEEAPHSFIPIGYVFCNPIELLRGDFFIGKANMQYGSMANSVLGISIAFYQPQIRLVTICFWINSPS